MNRSTSILSLLTATVIFVPAALADDWEDCRTGEAKASIRACSTIIDNEPKDKSDLAEAHYLRGKAHSERKEYGQAVTDFDRVVELEPRNADAYAERGKAYEEQEKYDLARRDYEHAATLYPADTRYGSPDDDSDSKDKEDVADESTKKKPSAAKSKRAKRKATSKKRRAKKKSPPRKRKVRQAKKKKSKPKENIRAKINKQVGCTVAGGFDC